MSLIVRILLSISLSVLCGCSSPCSRVPLKEYGGTTFLSGQQWACLSSAEDAVAMQVSGITSIDASLSRQDVVDLTQLAGRIPSIDRDVVCITGESRQIPLVAQMQTRSWVVYFRKLSPDDKWQIESIQSCCVD
jgi:hypothetical protein